MSLQTDNDELGHGRGDEVLAAVGVALQSTARDSDFVGRYGGEEFIILLPNTDREGAAVITERVRQTIAGIDVLGERRITASFGIAVFPEDAPDPTRLIRNADRALYRAKANAATASRSSRWRTPSIRTGVRATP